MSTSIHATKLADGRRQLWVVSPGTGLFTSVQESLNPAHPWSPLKLFHPAPPGHPQDVHIVAAGHSPDGVVQLWAGTQTGLFTVRQTGPDPAWGSWEAFQEAERVSNLSCVAQLKDGRMQAFSPGGLQFPWRIRTAWKTSTHAGAGWSDWHNIDPPPDSDGDGFMSSMIVGRLSDGRLQRWVTARKNSQSEIHLYTSWQTSTDPAVAWTDWQRFNAPPHHTAEATSLFGESELVDDRTHLWLVSPSGTLQSIKKTSSEPDSDWGDWTDPFHQPGSDLAWDFAATTLHDGSCQIWMMTRFGAHTPSKILTARQIGSNPLVWSAWTHIGTLD
jgi:hypothetical protein